MPNDKWCSAPLVTECAAGLVLSVRRFLGWALSAYWSVPPALSSDPTPGRMIAQPG